jgi:hypothetical protein
MLRCRRSSWMAGRAFRLCIAPHWHLRARSHMASSARWRVKRMMSLPRRLLPCWWSSSHPMRVEPRPSALASCGPATSATASPVIFAALYARCRPPAGRVALHLCDATRSAGEQAKCRIGYACLSVCSAVSSARPPQSHLSLRAAVGNIAEHMAGTLAHR